MSQHAIESTPGAGRTNLRRVDPLPTDLTLLSDALGVSSAPNLGAGDVLRLAKVLDTCGDMALVDGALRRLQVVKLSQPRRSSA